ncbi:hypothetical protein H2198_001604 [Neophaeococcomyces mojaviensis]|uniref:Uncharacterized protein n=1 Tax=Neophaeococcomyces mojaviensis TaxID=3383035 RepID=A0ACC3AH39_9EURO|nr:hypothetical protein H2198_001604 [Knufia sp. JES_112]
MAPSFGSYWATQAVRDKLAAEIQKLNATPATHHSRFFDLVPAPIGGPQPVTPGHLPPDPRQAPSRSHVQSTLPAESKVCIVGAGVTGLYIAMILDSLEIPGLSYDILEGSGSTGGRLLTHYFSDANTTITTSEL